MQVFFKEIFIWQLLGLVLTYNFTDCDFEKIKKEYDEVIFPDLKSYLNGTQTTCNDCLYCKDRPDCLTKIERLTFHPDNGCKSLIQESFAKKTNATFTVRCPGYSGIQINNSTLTMRKRKREDTKNGCRKIASNLKGLWGRFLRDKVNKLSLKPLLHSSKIKQLQ